MRRRATQQAPSLVAEAPSSAQVNSLQRGLDILHLFDGRQPLLTQAEIASRLGLPRATVAKLLSTLLAQRFLRQTAGDAYEPDSACLALGRTVKRGLPVVQAAAPQMLRLAEEFGIHVSLMARERLQMLVLEHAVPKGQSHLGLATGALVPIAGSASGRAYLWAQKPALQAQLIEALKESGVEKLQRFMPGVYAAFQELEERGFCFMSSPVTRQSNSIATPLHERGVPLYALAAMSVAPGRPGGGGQGERGGSSTPANGEDAERLLTQEVGPRLLQLSEQISRDVDRLLV